MLTNPFPGALCLWEWVSSPLQRSGSYGRVSTECFYQSICLSGTSSLSTIPEANNTRGQHTAQRMLRGDMPTFSQGLLNSPNGSAYQLLFALRHSTVKLVCREDIEP